MQEETTLSNGNPLRLERLEIFGFKSFAEKTVFAFEPGITAIVGPNGCGKTNVMDAVRWALGEQSAYSMRGSRMEEVIFNGTEKIKPLGMSEVTLTLKNENGYLPIDYSEVSITRRIFRSGESEYLINKNPCRLKDVQELFMDTGVGTKAYSFIEQGKVDMILSSRPEDRRFLFEEAAGIGKYKSRKREAERKLDSTEQNLIRINDIIAEVKRQINSLKRQVSRAKRYSALSDELKELETLSAVNEYSRLKFSLGASEKKFEEVSALAGRLLSDVGFQEAEIRGRRKALEEKELSASHISGKVNLINEEAVNLNSQVMLYQERIGALKNKIESAVNDKESLAAKLEGLKDELKGFDSETHLLRDDILTKEKQLKTGQEKLEKIASDRKSVLEEIESFKAKLMDAASAEARLRSGKADLESVFRSFEAREKRLRSERSELDVRGRTCAEAFAEAHRDYQRFKEQAEQSRGKLSEINEKINSIGLKLQNLKDNISGVREQLNSSSSALGLMEEMKINYEGYGAGVQALVKEGQTLGSLRPVGDMVQVDQELRPAIESALQEAVQYIAVKTIGEADRASSFLKQTRAGRAGFVVLELVKENESPVIPAEISSHPGIMGRASEMVKFREDFRALGELLLGKIIIARTSECARNIFIKLPPGWKIASLEGELFDPRGFISSGSAYSHQSGLVGRDNVIRELRDSVENLSSEISRMREQEKQILEELQSSAAVKEKFSSEFEDVSKQLLRAEGDFYRLKSEEEKIKQDLSVVDSELLTAASDKSSSKDEVLAADGELQNCLQKKSDVEAELLSLQRVLENSSREREDLLTEITEIKISAARLKEKEESSRSHFIFKQQAAAECEEDISRKENDIRESSQRIVEYGDSIKDFSLKLEELGGEKDKHSAVKEQIERECAGFSAEIEKMEEQLSSNRNELNLNQEQSHRLEMKSSEVKMQIRALKERMFTKHRVDLDSAEKQEPSGEADLENLNDETARIQAKLDAMGPVNLIAIEEYRELEERHEFLCSQAEDLAAARETLQKAISRINQTARAMFLEAFKAINKSFGEIFTGLFGGGRAELMLVDEKNVLESGIEIIARPPGKKLQAISLLSGGEKSMTAIALLFAILKNKPSPFCVLDEIDAALDDANIERFVDMVKGFSESTQFLIVTHNKTTISAASMIYGITMEQEGVSKPISIRFSDKDNSQDTIDEIEKLTGEEPFRAS